MERAELANEDGAMRPPAEVRAHLVDEKCMRLSFSEPDGLPETLLTDRFVVKVEAQHELRFTSTDTEMLSVETDPDAA